MPAAAPPHSRPRYEWRALSAAFWLILAFQIALPWTSFWFPSQDGPSALYGGYLLNHLIRGDVPLFDHFYQINHHPDPYWLSQIILALLLRLFSPFIAEKIFVSLYLLLYGLGVRTLARSLAKLNPDPARALQNSDLAALLALPLALGWPLHIGFYNYVLGFALSPWVLAAWMAARAQRSAARSAALAFMAVLLFLTHLIAWAMVFSAAATTALIDSWPAAKRLSPKLPAAQSAQFFIAQIGRQLAPFAPSALLALWFAAHMPPPFPGESHFYFSFAKIWPLISLQLPLISFAPEEAIAASSLALALLLLLIVATTSLLARRPLGLFHGISHSLSPSQHSIEYPPHPSPLSPGFTIAAVWMFAYMLAPDKASGAYMIYARLSLYPVLGAAIWLGSRAAPRWARRTAATLAILASAAQWASLARVYARLAPSQRAFIAASAEFPSRTVVLLIPLTPYAGSPGGHTRSSVRVRVFLHAASYLAMTHESVDLSDFTSTWKFAPVYIRESLNPRNTALGDFYFPAALRPFAWEKAARTPIGAVFIYDSTRSIMQSGDLASLKDELAHEFTPPDSNPQNDYQILHRKP